MTTQLADAQTAAEDAHEKMQQSLAVAAAAVAQHSSPAAKPGQPQQAFIAGQLTGQTGSMTSSAAAAAGCVGVLPGAGVGSADVLSCGGGGLLGDLPVAVQQEIAAQRRIAAAAKRDKVGDVHVHPEQPMLSCQANLSLSRHVMMQSLPKHESRECCRRGVPMKVNAQHSVR